MQNVTLDEIGEGWAWYGTSRGKRHTYRTARDTAVREFGKWRVFTAEMLTAIPDRIVLCYAAEACGCRECFGAGVPQDFDLLETPRLHSERYSKYRVAAERLGLKIFANLPPNWRMVVEGDTRGLAVHGQLGLGFMQDEPREGYPLAG